MVASVVRGIGSVLTVVVAILVTTRAGETATAKIDRRDQRHRARRTRVGRPLVANAPAVGASPPRRTFGVDWSVGADRQGGLVGHR